MTSSEFEQSLCSNEIEKQVQAEIAVQSLGPTAIPVFQRVLSDRTLNGRCRASAIRALGLLSTIAPDLVGSIAIAALQDSYAGTRAIALAIVADLRLAGAVDAVGKLLNDSTEDPTAWVDEHWPISRSARETLVAIGTPQALLKLEEEKRAV